MTKCISEYLNLKEMRGKQANAAFFNQQPTQMGGPPIEVMAPKGPPPQAFNQPQMMPQQAAPSSKGLDGALKKAKTSGTFTLPGRQLKEVPKELCNFAELDMGENFWEGYDLTKVDLSNNQI